MNELEIIKSCQNGDFSRFGDLYDLYIDKIYKFVYLKTYDKDIAEDITSDTFYKAINKIDTFKIKEGNSFNSWIYKIAYNNIVDFYKSKKEEFSLDEALDKSEENNLVDDIYNKDKLKEVSEYLKTLKEEHRKIIIMRLWDNLSYKEISEITGKSVDNCKKIFSRSIKKINENITMAIMILLFM